MVRARAGTTERGATAPVSSRRLSERLRNRDDDLLRQSPANSPDAGATDGGMLGSFDSEFAADPNADWLNQHIKFGSGPASPTIAQEEAEQRRQHDASPYLDDGDAVPPQLTQNYPLTAWRRANRNKALESLPDAIKDVDPDEQLYNIDHFGVRLNDMRPAEAPRAYVPSADGNDRGMLDDFDAEFKTGAPLDDANLSKSDMRELEKRRYGGDSSFKERRASNYGVYRDRVYEHPAQKAPKTESQDAFRKKVNKNMRYVDDGVALRDGDPRTRGTGQDPIQRRPGLLSRMGSGISNWWRGSKLNWANWGGSRRQRAG